MRWYAAATVSLTLLGAVFGCGSAGHTNFIAPPDDTNEGAGRAPTAGSDASTAANGGDSGEGSELLGGSGGGGGSSGAAGDAGAGDSDAGAAQGGNAGSGGAAPIPTLPSAPTALVLKVAGPTSIHLSWTDNADNEAGYKLYWSSSSSKPAQPSKLLVADATSGDADGLTMGKEYNFWVEAFNALGSSSAIKGK